MHMNVPHVVQCVKPEKHLVLKHYEMNAEQKSALVNLIMKYLSKSLCKIITYDKNVTTQTT
jgi:hypothetical protein